MFNKKFTASILLTMMMVVLLSTVAYAYPNNMHNQRPDRFMGNGFNSHDKELDKFVGRYQARITEKGLYVVEIKKSASGRLEATIDVTIPEAQKNFSAFSWDITPISQSSVNDEITFTTQNIRGLETKVKNPSWRIKLNPLGDELTVKCKEMFPSEIVLERI